MLITVRLQNVFMSPWNPDSPAHPQPLAPTHPLSVSVSVTALGSLCNCKCAVLILPWLACFRGHGVFSFMSSCGSGSHFLRLTNISSCRWTAFCLILHPSMNTQAAPTFGSWNTAPLNVGVQNLLVSILLETRTALELLDHMGSLFAETLLCFP